MLNKLITILLIVLSFAACNTKEVNPADIAYYSGPVATAHNLRTTYSDSAKTKVIVNSKLQLEYTDGDREFPKGIQVDFFNPDGKNAARLTANYARYEKQTNLYIATGNVIIKDFIETKTLNTEELRWNRAEKRIFTDKFVRIQTATELLTGTGLTAAQDFSTYRILKPAGSLSNGTL